MRCAVDPEGLKSGQKRRKGKKERQESQISPCLSMLIHTLNPRHRMTIMLRATRATALHLPWTRGIRVSATLTLRSFRSWPVAFASHTSLLER